MLVGRRSRFLVVALLIGASASLAASKDFDPAKQRDEQKKIKQRIDETARRLSSTLNVMAYQRLSPTLQSKVLDGVANELRGLSENEIKEILAKLEAAIAAAGSENATAVQKEALAKQRLVVEQLRGMLFKIDVIKSLDEAAARLDRAADTQLSINDETLNNARIRRRGLDDREQLGLEQDDLRKEIAAVFQQVGKLLNDPEISRSLSQEQKERLEAAEVVSRGNRLIAEVELTVRTLRAASFADAGERQRRHIKELKDLAAALRTPPANRLEALKVAAAKVAAAIDAQTKVNNDSTEKITQAEADKARRSGVDPKVAKGNELANQQTKAALAAYEARKAAVQADAPEAVDRLNKADTNQNKSEDTLREGKIEKAKEPQDNALEELKAAKAELDRQIAAAELAKQDPLAAVKQASERIEQLIKDQKEAQKKAEKAEANPNKLADAKVAQKDVNKGTDEVRNMPLPPNEQAKAALDKAAEAQKNATDKLDNKAPAEAKADQKQAVKALEEAKAALDQQAKNIEERREQIAKLEELKNKLDELAKNEKNVAKEADKAAADPKKPDTGDIAKKQDELKEPTKDAGMQLKELADENKNTDPMAAEKLNKAAEKVNDANMKQEGAKNDLAMNMPMAGGEKAKEAAEKLEAAAKDVQAQIDQKKGQEAKDQAALQPNKVDPMNAADQVQKALEQANMAAQKAMEANMAVNQPMMDPAMGEKGMPMAGMPNDKGMPMNEKGMMGEKGMMPEGMPNIADLQKQIAKQAAEQKLPEAAMAADMAAKALEKGDLPGAIENQQKALEQLNKAAMQPMEGGEKGMQPGEKGMQPGEKGMQPGEKGMQPGEKGMGEKGMGMGAMPGELAKQQQQVLEATKALQQSQQANNAAQAAIQQAQANAPMAVQQQLQQAQQQLQQAQQQLQQAQPGQAGMNQQNAAQALQMALDTLQAAQQPGMGMGMMGEGMGMAMGEGMGMGQGMGMGMGMGMAQGMGMGMGQGMGMGMGMAQGMGMGMGMGNNAQQGMNTSMGEGDMQGGDKLKNEASTGTLATGDGTFIKLRNKDREKVQQGADTQFPAEFREMIKQYNVNIKNAKPTAPAGK